ncbi:hypothetical protein [Streptomyces luteireticuli]|uniref:hypothetical protein n=1 Tax=Streptomyces luteireticuli TaxID=173858 RepID=UPI0035574A4D
MKFILLQIFGMVMMAVGGQGVIRLLVDHDKPGLLGWLPGGFPAALGGHVAIVVIGLLLGGWANDRAKAGGHLD